MEALLGALKAGALTAAGLTAFAESCKETAKFTDQQ